MSGGRFDYIQYRVNDVADEIEKELALQGKPIPEDELWASKEYYEKNPQEKFYPVLRGDIAQKMKDAIMAIRLASIYIHRMDWHLSGDDGEDSFIERLREDIEELEKRKQV